ncbi:MAG: alpha/beta fold hydrolase [Gammaproteobacteria bacterium]|jgi:alpha-beta hydrolase superfamily lysophospholipase|nr:alpha/beta fold hydrolase [Pseudomonadota bacterium]
MDKISVTTGNKNTFYVSHYSIDTKPRAIVQILHGMAEHQRRYHDFINYLNHQGITVFIHDHLGHGNRVTEKNIKGFFAEQDGWNAVVNDAKSVSEIIKNLYPDVPLTLLGHSMGSYIGLALIELFNFYDSCILSGSSKPSKILLLLQKILLNSEVKKNGLKGYSKKIDKLIFGGFNKQIKGARTPHDWLSHDQNSVQDYLDDPLCGFMVTNSLWLDLAIGMESIYATKAMQAISNELPILLLAGANDPVGNNGKGPTQIYKLLHKLEKNVELKLFEDMRHEALNELNNSKVYDHIYTYIMKHHGT